MTMSKYKNLKTPSSFTKSVICGSHVLKQMWIQHLEEILLASQEAGNTHGRHAVPVLRATCRLLNSHQTDSIPDSTLCTFVYLVHELNKQCSIPEIVSVPRPTLSGALNIPRWDSAMSYYITKRMSQLHQPITLLVQTWERPEYSTLGVLCYSYSTVVRDLWQ